MSSWERKSVFSNLLVSNLSYIKNLVRPFSLYIWNTLKAVYLPSKVKETVRCLLHFWCVQTFKIMASLLSSPQRDPALTFHHLRNHNIIFQLNEKFSIVAGDSNLDQSNLTLPERQRVGLPVRLMAGYNRFLPDHRFPKSLN